MVNNRLSSRNFFCGLLCAAATLVHGSSAWISRHQRYNCAQASRVLPVWPAGGGDGESFVLVTGGAGYIGSHTCLELLKAGEKAVVVDASVNPADADPAIAGSTWPAPDPYMLVWLGHCNFTRQKLNFSSDTD